MEQPALRPQKAGAYEGKTYPQGVNASCPHS